MCNHFALLVGNVRTGSVFHGQWLSLFYLPDCLVFFYQGNGIILFYRRESTVPPGTSTTVRVPLVEVKVGTACNIMRTRIYMIILHCSVLGVTVLLTVSQS